jgi:hypothetical protein
VHVMQDNKGNLVHCYLYVLISHPSLDLIRGIQLWQVIGISPTP